MAEGTTVDPANLLLFDGMARDWWDPDGPNRLLHALHPARMAWIRDVAVAHFGADPRVRRPLVGLKALDVGCGGGLVAESLARLGAEVVGVDPSAEAIAVARDHAAAQGLAIAYRAGEVGQADPGPFDLVTCLEVLEHTTDRAAFLRELRARMRPGGLLVLSTPPRTLASLLIVKLGAEHVVRALPKGTHDWRRFLTRAELQAMLHQAGFRVDEVRGLGWSPRRGFAVVAEPRVGLILAATAVAP